jgi:hypothetical protein
MTAPPTFLGFALAGLGSLALSTDGQAETRLMPDANGAFVSTAPTQGPDCCSTGSPAAIDGSDPAVALAAPENADNAAPIGAASAPANPGAPKAGDLVPDAAAPSASGWGSLLSSLLQSVWAAR